MKLSLLAALLSFSPVAHAAEGETLSCQLAASPQSCKQNAGTAYEAAKKAKGVFESTCQEASQRLQSLEQQKNQLASQCSSSGKRTSGNVSRNARGGGQRRPLGDEFPHGQDSDLAAKCKSGFGKVAASLEQLALKLGQKAEAIERLKSQGGGSVENGCQGARGGNDRVMDQAKEGFQHLQQSAQSAGQDARTKEGTYKKLGSRLG